MIEKMIVALDGSESARKALNFALDIAEDCSASVLLVSIVPPLIIPTFVEPPADGFVLPPETMNEYMEETRARYEEVLSQALKEIKENRPNIEVSTRLVEGRPTDQIVKIAEEEGPDILVVGSRGLSGIEELFLGSVSEGVVHKAPCPVLVVK